MCDAESPWCSTCCCLDVGHLFESLHSQETIQKRYQKYFTKKGFSSFLTQIHAHERRQNLDVLDRPDVEVGGDTVLPMTTLCMQPEKDELGSRHPASCSSSPDPPHPPREANEHLARSSFGTEGCQRSSLTNLQLPSTTAAASSKTFKLGLKRVESRMLLTTNSWEQSASNPQDTLIS